MTKLEAIHYIIKFDWAAAGFPSQPNYFKPNNGPFKGERIYLHNMTDEQTIRFAEELSKGF